METHERIYGTMIRDHLANYRQMVFLSGPRQAGKTTLAKAFSTAFFSWDDADDRATILRGAKAVSAAAGLENARKDAPVLAFDEIHRHSRWKTFLKGFFDKNEGLCRVIATGSARMDVYKRGGDSMMGRYFPYRVHPFSVAELIRTDLPGEAVVRPPAPIADADWDALRTFGGFPEPLLLRNPRFLRKWRDLRLEQLLRQDLRDLSKTVEIDQIEALARLLAVRSGTLLVYASLAREVAASEPTAKRWVSLLHSLYYGFTVKPWFRNVENSLRKTRKWYLRDWSGIADPGSRNETFAACHLLKAVEGWTDLGLGSFELFYLRDKQKREVDFLVARDGEPWFLAEVKTGDRGPTDSLRHFQKATGAAHAFQICFERPFEEVDCFSRSDPVAVPARTLFSQLI